MFDPDFWRQVAQLPAIGLLLFLGVSILVGLYRQWWVPGWLWRGVVTENVELKSENKALRVAVSTLTTQLARERGRRGSDRPDA